MSLHPSPSMTVVPLTLNAMRRCPTCSAALTPRGLHADSGEPTCGWGDEAA